jgi:hypothetical protein
MGSIGPGPPPSRGPIMDSGGGPQVRAAWTVPDGNRRTGAVPALPGQRAGSTVLVWADAAGRLTGPPLTMAER